MPYLYVMTGAELADVLQHDGRTSDAATVLATTKQIAHAIQLDGVVRDLQQTPSAGPGGDSSGVQLRVGPATQPKTRSADPVARKP
jgi:hypothetical protein